MATKKNRLIVPNHILGNKKHYLYCHFNNEEHAPFYVGIGTKNKTNYGRAKNSINRNIFWKEKVTNNYLIIICCESDNYNQIKELEKEFISLYGLENLTNISQGGEGCNGYKHTQEHIHKLKENYKNGISPLFNREVSQTEKIYKSILYKGKNNPNYGNTGFKSSKGKVVEKLSIFNEVLETYGSIRDAAKHENVTHTSIRKAIINNTKCNNFKWRIKND